MVKLRKFPYSKAINDRSVVTTHLRRDDIFLRKHDFFGGILNFDDMHDAKTHRVEATLPASNPRNETCPDGGFARVR